MKLKHWLMLFALAFTGGSVYLLIEWGTEGFSAPFVAWTRPTIAALTLAVAMAFTSRQSKGLQATSADLRARPLTALRFGLFRFALPTTLLAVGQLTVPSHLAGILLGTIALFVALMAPFLDSSERLSSRQTVGFIGGFFGVVLVVGFEGVNTLEQFLGSLAILGAAVSWAYAVFIAKGSYTGTPALQATLTAALAGAALSLPAALATLPTAAPSLRAVLAVLVLGSFGTALVFWLLDKLIKEIGVSRTAIGTYLLPVVALFYGAVFNSEEITVVAVLGIALVLSGVGLASKKKNAVAQREGKRPPRSHGQTPIAANAGCDALG